MIRQRVSFYGIYELADRVELIAREFYYLRNQLEKRVREKMGDMAPITAACKCVCEIEEPSPEKDQDTDAK